MTKKIAKLVTDGKISAGEALLLELITDEDIDIESLDIDELINSLNDQ